MIADILAKVANLVIKIISDSGYFGITSLMAIESACIPVPSEIIMPFAGFLTVSGKLSLLLVIVWGAVGNLIGSIIAYAIGAYGGRPFIEKYGKYALIGKDELDKSQKFFTKHGSIGVFFSRLLPVVRTFISLPAGIARMPFAKFCLYTFIGSFFWSALLAWIGVFLGENWQSIETYFRKFDWLILIAIIAFIVLFIYKKIKK
ncbi:MAG: DedA family protein [bacterium]|nr:DedA family protein [bacterium]